MRNKAFSLVEVVVAVGIFAISIVGVIGLLAPTSKSINDVRDADDASRVVSIIQAQLQQLGFTGVQTALTGNYTYVASRNGDKLGKDDSTWTTGFTALTEPNKFFEIALTRNTTLSPSVATDANSGYLAFTISLRWPAWLPSATSNNAIKCPDAQKSVMIFPAAITR